MLSNRYKRVPCEQIIVKRDERQRRSFSLDDLIPSIRARGVIQPIIVDDDLVLIAGERRLAASLQLKLYDIPVRFASDLSPIEMQIIELEENLKRKDLSWEDQCQAVVRIHNLYKSLDPEWTQKQTADALGLTAATISMQTMVGNAILDGNERIAKASNYRQAHNTLAREQSRRADTLLSELTEGITKPGDSPTKLSEESVLCENFLLWAPQYSGQKFNFGHFDFPYGVNMQDSDQGNSELYGVYDDTPEIYWALLNCLARHQNQLFFSSSHLMFWFSMKFYCETREFFRQRMPDWTLDDFPLLWLKSDNKGILPDPKRGPRRIYETCFFASRGDRHIVRAVSNSYAAPTGTKAHQSEKPEPVLRHFMQMFVDEHTRMLDPTCGSGSSLRAAESLKATSVLGLELNPDFAEGAKSALKNFRTLRAATKHE